MPAPRPRAPLAPPPSGRRPRRRGRAILAALAALGLAACSSPNRGTWSGTFGGSVSGVVEFRINARGTRLVGSLTGTTRDGQPFAADMEGKMRGEHFYATFEGTSRTGLLPVAFTGLMRGTLAGGEGAGEWTCEVKVSRTQLQGSWEVDQVRGEG